MILFKVPWMLFLVLLSSFFWSQEMNYVGLYATFQRVGRSQSQGSEVQVVFLTSPKNKKKCTGFPSREESSACTTRNPWTSRLQLHRWMGGQCSYLGWWHTYVVTAPSLQLRPRFAAEISGSILCAHCTCMDIPLWVWLKAYHPMTTSYAPGTVPALWCQDKNHCHSIEAIQPPAFKWLPCTPTTRVINHTQIVQ